MPGRMPTAVRTNLGLGLCALIILLASGCAGWRVPRIDPTGERFFIWPNEIPGGGVVGSPVATTGPTYSPVPPSVPSIGPPASTLSGQVPLVDPSLVPQGNVDIAPVWPNSNATSLFPNGFSLPSASPTGPAPIPTLVHSENGPVVIPVCPDAAPGVGPCAPIAVPLAGPPLAVPTGPVDQVLLSPKRLLAPVGSEVILRAGICTAEGHLISNQRIEWLLANEGVGQFVTVGERSWAHPLSKPKKIDNHYAIGRTHGKSIVLDRGTADPSDDVQLRDGEAWISVTSPTEGTSLVTAVAPAVEAWKRRKATSTIYWIDAQWIFPPPTSSATGTSQALTTHVTRRTNGTPIAGWQVRYEILDRGAAGFAPDGAEAVVVTTNELGQATVEISQADPNATSARIAVSIIRPANLGTSEPLVLGNGTTSVSWATPDIAIDSTGPASTTVGAAVTYQINVSNPGAATARDVVVMISPPAGLNFVASNPAPTSSGRRLEWSLGNLGPGQMQSITVEYSVERATAIDHCATVHTADGLRTEHCTSTQVATAEAVLDIQMTGPQTAEVGGIVEYQVVVINRGSAPANGLVITDRFDSGLEHPGDTERTFQIERSLGNLQPGESSQPVAITFNVITAGRQCHEVEIRGDGGLYDRLRACVDVRERTGDVVPPVGPPSSTDPPVGAAMEVEKIGPRQARVGEKILLKFVVKNTGDVDLHHVAVEEEYTRELKPIQATEGRTLDGRTLRWTIIRLPVGERRVFEVEYECLEATDINGARTTNSASVGNLVRADQANVEILPRDVIPPDSTGTGPAVSFLGSTGISKLELQIAKYADRVRVGERTIYSVSIHNKGRESDSQLVLVVAFPPELTPDVERINQTLRSKGIRASVSGQTLQFSTIRLIRAGETISLTLSFNANRAGPVRIRAELQSAGISEPLHVEETAEVLPP